MLDLSNVTLVTIDSAADHLSKSNIRLAIMSKIFPKIIENIKFGDTLVINPFNKNAHLIDEKFDTLWDYNFDSNERNIMWYSNFLIKKLPLLIKTEWYLIIQWDGFPLFDDMTGSWKNDFFNFPYLGGGHSLYNGGFSLRNTKIMRELSTINDTYGMGAEDGFYSAFFDNEYNIDKNTPIKFKWDDNSKIVNKFCAFFEYNIKNPDQFGWHRSGYLSENTLYNIYQKTECFTHIERQMIVKYCATKELVDTGCIVDDYMKYFDMEYNENFYNY